MKKDLLTDAEVEGLILSVLRGSGHATEEEFLAATNWVNECYVQAALAEMVCGGEVSINLNGSLDYEDWHFSVN